MNEKEKDFSIADIIETIISKWYIILSLALIMSLLIGVKVNFYTPDTYEATSTLYVRNYDRSLEDKVEYIDAYNIQSSRTLSETYIEILKTRSFLTDVSKNLEKPRPWEAIRASMAVSALSETELISVRVVTTSPEESFNIAKTISEKAPEKLQSIFKNGDVFVIDEAVMPTRPNGKGLLSKVILGFIIGLILGVVIVFVFKFFDRKIHKSEDVSKRYNISVLGELTD